MTVETEFNAMQLCAALTDKLKERGIVRPTAVQAEAIPAIMEGRDLVARSQTGTGKTLAFLLPILERIDPASKKLQALIVAPTQELAMQILREAEVYGADLGVRSQALIGGAALSRQLEKLKLHPQLAIGTPGRLLELLKLRKLSLQDVRTIVFDEVDQVFALGGAKDVDTILARSGSGRQLLFFSATIPDTIRDKAQRWMREPVWLQVAPQHRAAETLQHVFIMCDERDKIDTLRRLLLNLKPAAALVFINETDDAAEVEAKLAYGGLAIGALYGDAGKQDRSRVMQSFRSGKLRLLLATDVAARGLDLPEVTHVFNLDVAGGVDPYVHRAGRTGRMGRTGTVISIVSPRERFIMDKFAKALGVTIAERTLYGGKLVAPQEAGPGARGKRPAGGDVPSRNGAVPRERREGRGPAASGGAHTAAVRAAEPAAAGRRGGAPAAAVKPARTAAAAAQSAPAPQAKPKERERDRKNKGAPRWLKEKRKQDE